MIGGGEPSLPGVSIGHNEYGAWGLTVFATDGEDLYVYDTNPSNPNEYRYRGEWEPMTVHPEEIPVKGQEPAYRRAQVHAARPGRLRGQRARHLAYAVRAAWMEIGGAPYLASLRMDQATTWEEFREACSYSHIPGENMVWADRDGTIGWQAVGIAPIRRNWSGLVPGARRRTLRVGRLPAHQGQAPRGEPRRRVLRHGQQRPHPPGLPLHGRGRVRVVRPLPLAANHRGAGQRAQRSPWRT